MPFGVTRPIVGGLIRLVVESDGAADAARPVALNAAGKLDISLLSSTDLSNYILSVGDPVYVRGPASAADTALAIYNGTTGKIIKNSTVLLSATALTLPDALNLVLNATTGTKIGTATTQKLGFWNAAPVVQPSAYTQTFSTADKTLAGRTAAELTDNSAGTPSTTIAALPDPADAPATVDALRDDLVANLIPALRNAIASLADQINKSRVDSVDTTSALNSVIDDLQSMGLVG